MKEKPSSGTKQFLLTLLATTFSIILTFGTSAIIEPLNRCKKPNPQFIGQKKRN